MGATDMTDVSLLGLTSLRQLTRLELYTCGIAEQRRYCFDGDVQLTATGYGRHGVSAGTAARIERLTIAAGLHDSCVHAARTLK
jgi:hypothetical protein